MKQQPAKGKQLWNFHQGLFKSEPTLQPEFYILPGLIHQVLLTVPSILSFLEGEDGHSQILVFTWN